MPTSLLRRAALPLVAVALLAGCGTSAADTPAPADPPVVDPASIDWKPRAYEALGCHSREEWVAGGFRPETWDEAPYDVVGGRVLGNDDPDAVVSARCPNEEGPASQSGVLVFDRVADDAEVVAVLHDELVFRKPKTIVEEGTVVREGPTVGGSDASCCPEHWGRVEYRWVDGGFALVDRQETLTDRPISRAGLPDGSYVAILRAVDHQEVVVDLVEWLEGDAAVAACGEDGMSGDAQWMCRMYYVREGDRQAHALPVSDTAPISYLDAFAEARPAAAVTDLRSTGSISDGPIRAGLFDVQVRDGVVVDLRGRYTP